MGPPWSSTLRPRPFAVPESPRSTAPARSLNGQAEPPPTFYIQERERASTKFTTVSTRSAQALQAKARGSAPHGRVYTVCTTHQHLPAQARLAHHGRSAPTDPKVPPGAVQTALPNSKTVAPS